MSDETIQFYDGVFPLLRAGDYRAHLEHDVTGGPDGAPSWTVDRLFTVAGPQFTIDPSSVVSVSPPDGATGTFDDVLPFVVLDDPTLPWERSLVPGDDAPSAGDALPMPWVALIVLADADRVATGSGPVGTVLQTTDDVLAPAVTPPDPTAPIQTVTVSGVRFSAIMPTTADLPHLAHCQALAVSTEPAAMSSVVVANRLAVSAAGATTFHAHLVSLEGLQDALAPGAALPQRADGTGPKDVVLASLSSWSFVSTAEGTPFPDLVAGVIAHQGPLAVPVTGTAPPPTVGARLSAGYAPLPSVLPSGEALPAWCRGPLAPVVAQPLAIAPGASSDALLVYDSGHGVLDVTYAAAWQLGRALALADGTFTQALIRYRQAARQTAGALAARQAVPHLAGADPATLVAPNPTRRALVGAIAAGAGDRWTAALAPGADAGAGAAQAAPAPAPAGPPHAAVAALLAQPDAASALAESLADLQAPVASWLAALALLTPLPFAQLIPDEAMLPPESARFFYVDAGWSAAAAAGAMSAGIHGSADVALDTSLRPSLDAAVAAVLAQSGATAGAPLSGMLLRSALVPGWPTLVVAPTAAGAPLPTVRRTTLGADVLLCLWSGVPDAVTLAEPYQGLRFGMEEDAVPLRDVTTPGRIGTQLNLTVPATVADGRVDVAALATAIGGKLGIPALGAGDLAIQLVLAPDQQTFPEAP